jgi:hypothetical protein
VHALHSMQHMIAVCLGSVFIPGLNSLNNKIGMVIVLSWIGGLMVVCMWGRQGCLHAAACVVCSPPGCEHASSLDCGLLPALARQ